MASNVEGQIFIYYPSLQWLADRDIQPERKDKS
jgi:hypothetical protein